MPKNPLSVPTGVSLPKGSLAPTRQPYHARVGTIDVTQHLPGVLAGSLPCPGPSPEQVNLNRKEAKPWRFRLALIKACFPIRPT